MRAPRAVRGERSGWTGRLWRDIDPTFQAILQHPFITELCSGELSIDRFVHFISQDTYYLRDYTRALLALAAKAPTHEATGVITMHAAAAAMGETTLHAELMTSLGRHPSELEEIDPQPTTRAYTSLLVSTTLGGDYTDGLGVVLPCFWVYGEVGLHLRSIGSANAVYQRWIDNYSSPEYQHDVDLALDLADTAGLTISSDAEVRASEYFRLATRYEWMFWDAAYNLESWPLISAR